MEKYPRISFRISQHNLDFLNKVSKGLDTSRSAILNYLIQNHLAVPDDFVLLDSIQLNEPLNKTIKINLSQREYDSLKELVKINFNSTINKEIKYFLLNQIYKEKLLNNKEIESLSLTRAELNKIGSNLNQIARALNTEVNSKINIDNMLLENLISKIVLLSAEIKQICINSKRLNK